MAPAGVVRVAPMAISTLWVSFYTKFSGQTTCFMHEALFNARSSSIRAWYNPRAIRELWPYARFIINVEPVSSTILWHLRVRLAVPRFFRNWSAVAAWRCATSCDANVFLVRRSVSTHCGRRPAFVEWNISSKVDWTWRVYAWPSRSLGVSSVDFLMWARVKEHVYAVRPRTVEDPVAKIACSWDICRCRGIKTCLEKCHA
jgi:hypothetical protein